MFTKTYLENSIPVLMEQIPTAKSVIIGVWVKVGARHEEASQNGISHFLEHMFFKGTKKRTAQDIAFEIDSLGGDLNAFTSRENTAFYVKVLDEYLVRAVELLSDIFLHSTFSETEIEKEKGVIKEEIKMVEDTPDDYIHDLFSLNTWGDKDLGQPVLGKKSTITAFTRDDLIRHVKKYYGTADTVIACAGNFDKDNLLEILNKYFGSLRRGSEPKLIKPSEFKSTLSVHHKELSEAHLCIGVKGLPFNSPQRYTLALLNAILGASVSSRLFQEIREKKGFAYSIYSYISSYIDTGYWAVYAGTGKSKAALVAELILKEMKNLYCTLTDTELRRAKDQVKGNLILAMESTSSRMQSIARQEIYYGRYFSPDEIMADVEAVSLNDAKDLACRLINEGPVSMTVLGSVSKSSFEHLF